MEAQFLPREAFADEQSYIAHRQHIASLHRTERLKRNVQPRTYRWGKMGSRTWRVHRRMMQREYSKRWYWSDPERARATFRYRYWSNPERARSLHRERAHRYYTKHREEECLRVQLYKREHRDEVLRKKREYAQNKRAEKQGYVGQAVRSKLARQFQNRLIALRSEGLSWREIEKLTGRSWKSCQTIYFRAVKRQQRGDQQQSA